jgi:predicted O-linked N-acetylglucosamine transferase (SPINDLY family)
MSVQDLIQRALGLHQQGQLVQAADLYEQALKLEPQNFAALQFLGVLRAQQGRNVEAARLMESVLALQPDNLGALINYSQVLMGTGRVQDALATLDKALAIKPDVFEALYNRGIALAQLQRHAEAVTSFDRALALRPDAAHCLYNRGLAQLSLGWRDDALASYDRAVALQPGLAPAWHNRGNVLRELGRPAQALESYDKALALTPQDALLLYSRGSALSELGRQEDAAASFGQSLALQPQFGLAVAGRGAALLKLERFAEALADLDQALAAKANDAELLNNRGVALYRLDRIAEARAAYDKALAAAPDHVESLLNRAFLLQATGNLDAALTDYEKAASLAPANARAFNGRGSVLHALKRESEALADFDRALALDEGLADALANRAHLRWSLNDDYAGATADLKAALTLNPDQAYARGELLHLQMFAADWDDFENQKALVDQGVRAGKEVVRPFVYQAVSASPADLQACSRIFAGHLFPPQQPRAIAPRSRDRIRIGYVSGEFREQATAYLMAGLYELHDKSRFEIVAIDNGGGDGSVLRRRLETAFDRILYINQLSDSEAADRIHAEEIDILVNLNGYFGAPRMGIFARRPAPIQVNYLGFPATLGTPYMDYIVADKVVIPEGEQRFYDEQVVWLPHSYQVNDSKRAIAEDVPSRATLGLPEHGFVFCNFNQSYKLTPDVFACWMRLLKRTDHSVLWLLKAKPPFEANLARQAERQDVDPSRLRFAPSLPLEQHLARLKQADLFLDSLPYNAHTTASDALWAGLPLVTCRGTAFPGRVAASLLNAADLPELITENLDAYERLALRLAKDAEMLAELKQKLADNRLHCPLFDTDLFRKNLESAYVTMWRARQKGEAPRGFAVTSA